MTSIVGTGLIALDIIVRDEPGSTPRVATGGTCGNVLAILGFLGWTAYPVTRLNGDTVSRIVEADLRKWSVRLDYASLAPLVRTPIILHRIGRKPNGEPVHRFRFSCPVCGAWYPSFRPIGLDAAEHVVSSMDAPTVFFFDRASPGALLLAKEFRQRGSIVFFEPSTVGHPRLFRESVRASDIIKYSAERISSDLISPSDTTGVRLEIETLGSNGLRYRSGGKDSQWRHSPASRSEVLVDTAGAGDWCTAGLIYGIGQAVNGQIVLDDSESLAEVLRFAQAAAAWACSFEGARGGMYAGDKGSFFKEVELIASGSGVTRSTQVTNASDLRIMDLCERCAR